MGDWNPYYLILAFFIAGVILAVLFSWRPRVRRRHRPMWDAVTKRLGGKLFEKEGDFRVRFAWYGLSAVLSEGRHSAFEITGGEWGKLDLEIVANVRKHDIDKSRVEVDEAALPGCTLASSSLPAARQFLSAPVRRLLEELGLVAGLGLDSWVRVRIGNGFRVEASHAATAEALSRFAMLGLQLAQHARMFSRQETGIVFEDVRGRSGECQICGAALEGTLVCCSRCATPHHRDCWEYAGRCSTYGCGETKAAGA